jgi:hypothetical protein
LCGGGSVGIVGSGVRGEPMATSLCGGGNVGIVGSGVRGDVAAKTGAAARTAVNTAYRTFSNLVVIWVLLPWRHFVQK